jgi:hypothetical protein
MFRETPGKVSPQPIERADEGLAIAQRRERMRRGLQPPAVPASNTGAGLLEYVDDRAHFLHAFPRFMHGGRGWAGSVLDERFAPAAQFRPRDASQLIFKMPSLPDRKCHKPPRRFTCTSDAAEGPSVDPVVAVPSRSAPSESAILGRPPRTAGSNQPSVNRFMEVITMIGHYEDSTA